MNFLFWVDRVVAEDGTVLQQGTLMSAENFYNLEKGKIAAVGMSSELSIAVKHLINKTSSIEGLVIEKTLSNSLDYPFNDSVETIAFDTEDCRHTLDYTILVEVIGATGTACVGNIVISDKLLNGFKIEYTGSADEVEVKCSIQGGKY